MLYFFLAYAPGKRYVGTSCVMTLSSDPRRIELVEVCNMTEERLMLATVA